MVLNVFIINTYTTKGYTMQTIKKQYANDGTRLTDCCGAYSTYMETYYDPTTDYAEFELCCKECCKIVEVGQGDGNEKLQG